MYQSIASKYAAKSVFITGGTGFLGKVLMEKLLYSCPDIDNIYVLLRPKKNLSPDQRIEKMLDLQIFHRLINERPNYLNKIKPIAGDILHPRLGLSEKDEKLLIDSVSYVFHSAATVKFTEPLDVALKTNVKGSEKILNLCLRMKKIQALVHVSTAYTNTEIPIVNEVIYPPPVELDMIDQLIETAPDMDPKYITEKILAKKPNTYTFSKSLAENLVVKNHGNVPLVIVRPSVVCASKDEPVPGWVDSWQAITGISTCIMKGFNKSIYGNPTNILDLIPVDYVSNVMIVAAAQCQPSKEVTVYHACTSSENPITWKEYGRLIATDSVKHNFNEMPMPTFMVSNSRLFIYLTNVILEIIPVILGDLWLRLLGKEPRLMKTLKQSSELRESVEFFSLHSWIFNTRRSSALAQSLSAADKREFPFNPSSINWNEYMPLFCGGIRKKLSKNTKNL